jgi:Na+-translocating ferredoxin:NAD+ oxidoreductase RnfD subunit
MSVFRVVGNTPASVMRSTPLCCICEVFYQFVQYGGEEIHERIHFSACLDKIVSNLVKDSCTILISVCSCVLFAVIVAAGLSFSCPGVFVIRILAVVLGEENLVRMISL